MCGACIQNRFPEWSPRALAIAIAQAGFGIKAKGLAVTVASPLESRESQTGFPRLPLIPSVQSGLEVSVGFHHTPIKTLSQIELHRQHDHKKVDPK